ncbi:MAG: HAD family hydrolase [Candidatus Izimaplasma sp.]|nr:HAD family hydrolase [Candidatus Izimaplasma bacterium]
MALIFLDLDGTLLYRGEIVAGMEDMIKQLKSRNHEVAIATGRNPVLLNDYHEKLKVDHLVLANGGLVLSNNKVIKENFIPYKTVKKMMDFSDKHKFDLVIEYEDEYISYRKDTEASNKFSETFNLPDAKYDNKLYPKRNVFAMVVFSNDLVDELRKEFSELQFNRSNKYGFDVNPQGELKASGVKTLIKHLNIDFEDTYAFGDGFNDIKMLKSVKHGVAMGNAVDELKAVAEYVTDHVNDNGLVKGLKHYHLI